MSALPRGKRAGRQREFLFSWLHLSDVHVGQGSPAYQQHQRMVLKALAEDLDRCVRDGTFPCRPTMLLLTGDLAFSGAARDTNEYRRTLDWLGRITRSVDLDLKRVLAVPGNHDVRRTDGQPKEVRRLVKELRSGGLDNALADPTDRQRLARRMLPYLSFSRSLAPVSSASKQQAALYWTYLKRVSGLRVHFLGLNTSLLSDNDEDCGKLALGRRQVADTLFEADPTQQLVIALAHHPFEWLADGDEVGMHLRNRTHVYLHGHLHDPRTERIQTGTGAGYVRIAAGAVHHGDNSYRGHSYNLAAVWRDGRGRLHLRLFPRFMTKEGQFRPDVELLPEGNRFVDYALRASANARDTAGSQAISVTRALALAGARATDEMSRRRTAYPTDVSFGELFTSQAYISPRLRPVPGSDRLAEVSGVAELVERLRAGRNVLVLGEPGAGKSFLTYLSLQELARIHSKVFAVPVDVRVLMRERADSEAEWRVRDVAAALLRAGGFVQRVSQLSTTRAIAFIIDGIDEFSSTGGDIDSLTQALENLRRLGSILVTCRRQDYERVFAARMGQAFFDEIWAVEDWDPRTDFPEFVRKLEAARFAEPNPQLLDAVARSPVLQELVRRPLHARMLTYIGPVDMSQGDLSRLYSEFLRKLAAAIDAQLLKLGCVQSAIAFVQWRKTAWDVHAGGLMTDDKIPKTALQRKVLESAGLGVECADRLLHPIFNDVQLYGSTYAQYIHFSFFEYMVAEYMANGLVGLFDKQSVEAFPFFARDLTPEIRHYLLRVLRTTAPNGLAAWLARVYLSNSLVADNADQRRTANNLLVYVVSRLREDSRANLRELLQTERDSFLRTSLYWGLCHLGDSDSLAEYIRILQTSHEMAALNRGYLLYYYGDIDRRSPPPYLDDDPGRTWTNTRLRVVELMAAGAYSDVSPVRRALDLYTLFDFCLYRAERLSGPESAVALAALEGIELNLGDRSAIDALRRMQVGAASQ